MRYLPARLSDGAGAVAEFGEKAAFVETIEFHYRDAGCRMPTSFSLIWSAVNGLRT